MIQVTASHRGHLTAADDAHRMLLSCVLHDAAYLHFDVKAACPSCRAVRGDACCGCWIPHQEPITRYGRLSVELESFQGIAEGTAYPLTAEDLELLAVALLEAISYRQARDTAEDRALLAAYHALASGATR